MKFKILLSIIFFSSLAEAGDRITSNWFIPIQFGSDHNGPVFVVAPTGVADECASNKIQSHKSSLSGTTDDGYKTFISIALAAHMTKKQVQIEYDNGPGCYAYRISMK
ncbi:hypothetical protein A3759_15695 [Thalassolituus sp. HI0120]|jgi:hypothetical protein|nr:hypothetical protein A3759_15695 [Thalassolituus sp. HI0120]